MTDLEKALAKIEEGTKELRPFDSLAAYDIEKITEGVRLDVELDEAQERAA